MTHPMRYKRLYIHFQDREAGAQGARPCFNSLTEQHKQKELWEKRTPHLLCWPPGIQGWWTIQLCETQSYVVKGITQPRVMLGTVWRHTNAERGECLRLTREREGSRWPNRGPKWIPQMQGSKVGLGLVNSQPRNQLWESLRMNCHRLVTLF